MNRIRNSFIVRQAGYVLLPVAFSLLVVALVAFLMNRESGMNTVQVGNQLAAEQLRLVAEAGLQHARWAADNSMCTGYTLPATGFGDHVYSATFTPNSGSPIDIIATGTLDSGMTRTMAMSEMSVYESPTTLVLQPDATGGKDTYLYMWQKSRNFGTTASLWVSNEWADSLAYSLYQFDVSAVPPTAAVTSAILELRQNTPSANGGTVGVRSITSDWIEGSKNGNNGDSNWDNRDVATPWTTAGGDYASTVESTATIASGAVGPVQWDITDLVNRWVQGTETNRGFILTPESPNTHVEFDSSDVTTPANRPKLTITYACECGKGGGSGTITYQPGATGKDVYLRGTRNYGATPYTWIDTNVPYHALYEFDLSEFVPGITVTSAQLDIHQSSADLVTTPGNLDVHRATSAWVEGSGDNSGLSPPDGATWDSSDGTTPWGTAGGDYDATVVDSVLIDSTGAAWHQWDVQSLVQGWVSGTYPNHGFFLRAGSGDINKLYLDTGEDNDPALHPKLTISYSCGCGVPSASGSLFMKPGATAGKDTRLFSGHPTMAHGTENTLIVSDSGGNHQHSLLEFDLSGIPATALVTSATLELNTNSITAAGNVEVRRMTTAWDEINATWLDSDTAMPWTTAGGDFSATMADTQMISALVPYSFDVTPIVSDWFQGGQPNYGLVLHPAVGTNVAFVSSDNNNSSLHPKLTVNYICPCGIGCNNSNLPNILLSTATSAVLGGLSYINQDLVEYNPNDDTAMLKVDGNAIAFTEKFDALHMLGNGRLLVSVDIASGSTTTLGGLSIGKDDLAEYNPVTDTAVLILDGSSVFSGGSNNITAVHVQPDGKLILANSIAATLGGISFNPEDLVEYDPGTNTASLFFDGSAVGLTAAISSVHVLDSGNLVLSTASNASLGGLSFTTGDLVEYDPVNDTANLHFDGIARFGTTEEIISSHVGAGSGAIALPSGPLAHWKLDETSGTTATDSEGGHHGTLQNGPVWIAGTVDGALDFDGNDDYVDLTSDTELDDVFDGGATVMAWIEPKNWGRNGYGRIFDKSSSPSSTGDGWAIRLNKDNGGLNFGQGFSGGRGWWRIPDNSINLDTWQHVAITYDSSSTANDPVIYLDGIPLAVTRVDSPSGSFLTDSAINLRLGNHAGGTSHTFEGKIDDARIYDRILTETEIKTVSGSGGSCDATFADDFETGDYAGSTGTAAWVGDWSEINDSGNPGNGDVTNSAKSGNRVLVIGNSNKGAQRVADLSAYSTATLTVGHWISGLDGTDEHGTVEVSSDGSVWTVLDQYPGPGTDNASNPPTVASYDISAFLSATTYIRFLTSSTNGKFDQVFYDDIEICTNN